MDLFSSEIRIFFNLFNLFYTEENIPKIVCRLYILFENICCK